MKLIGSKSTDLEYEINKACGLKCRPFSQVSLMEVHNFLKRRGQCALDGYIRSHYWFDLNIERIVYAYVLGQGKVVAQVCQIDAEFVLFTLLEQVVVIIIAHRCRCPFDIADNRLSWSSG